MRTKTVTLYHFHELPPESQSKALERLYDINVDHEWWGSIYDDAKSVGLKIRGFDLSYRWTIKIERTKPAFEIMHTIIQAHGSQCATHETAKQSLAIHSGIISGKALDGMDEDAIESLVEENDEEFLRAIGQDYLTVLSNEHEYLTSEQAIKETIEYEFTITGDLAQ
jgi:hypothetical protein